MGEAPVFCGRPPAPGRRLRKARLRRRAAVKTYQFPGLIVGSNAVLQKLRADDRHREAMAG